MKRAYYIFLMMIFFTMISFFLYFAMLYNIIYYKIISVYQIIPVTDIAMSYEAYAIVALIGIILGYIFGKKFWKIIYVDKVYRFGQKRRRRSA